MLEARNHDEEKSEIEIQYSLIMQSPEIISRSARLPIDAEEDLVHREGGMISYLHEKISQ